MITRLLVANRGEIARRVLRTCRDLGIATVAVASDADAEARYVREADATVRLPGVSAAETYLRGDLLVQAALRSGADAVHPGYGFLSESAEFARQVIDAGLTWVGPPPSAMEAMASKVTAKRVMAAAGVPVLEEVEPASVTEAVLPVIVKASAGGGGRGMRVVRDVDALDGEVRAASAEAEASFGDPEVFCEPFVERGRHVEMQILADSHGTVWVLGERDCSVQRRHQKVVEETPSPVVDAALRAELVAAAESAAKAVGYVGAGTVEFLVDDAGPEPRFFFLEMNTRLQVEHPVTECVYGLDLVAQQLAIAEGESLPAQPPAPRGHALEARLYAEDPEAGWVAQSGTLHRFEIPGVDAEFTAPMSFGLRVDSGVESGSVVSPHYDAMLAKVVAWGPTRAAAARRLSGALAAARVHGLRTNRDLLVRILRDPAFLAGEATTAFLEGESGRRLRGGAEGDSAQIDSAQIDSAQIDSAQIAAVVAAVADAHRRHASGAWVAPPAWRNVVAQPQTKRYAVDGREVEARYRDMRGRLVAEGGLEIVAATSEVVVVRADGVDLRFEVAAYPDGVVAVDCGEVHHDLRRIPRFAEPQDAVDPGSLLAPMPGTVVAVPVDEGQQVDAGDPILVLEAMKMQHTIRADRPAIVTALPVSVGQQVDAGSVLAVVTAEGDH